ncbi:DNA repair and recombination protein RAD54B-like [Ylistrum balloti]|uniref:DNA repair and recombination protein RAD54B-like n=1 Tax=Ylistrum balloti TaxID=509963 RepID=UPI002905AE2E|nr:DNA repair and recombination protein RAD54B-like [Ylistrum balloti]
MRRSGAPSQGGVAKRPRFSAPFKTPVQDSHHQQATSVSQIKQDITTKVVQPETDVKNVVTHSEVTQQTEPQQEVNKVSKHHFKLPLHVRSSAVDNRLPQETNKNGAQETATEGQTRYLNVMWCKRSNKKHKKWEGDAILITKGRSVTLLDMDGKEIGKSSGYKSTELETLKDDETLVVGGKEIQVMSVMTQQQFKSGKCFSASSLTQSAPSPSLLQSGTINKAFVSPQTQGHSTQTAVKPTASTTQYQVQPRHSIDQPGALVMPRPGKQHQWFTNKNSLPIVDVVVDPHIASHLRPHQREGVIFLYECIMGFRDFGGQGAILADDMGLGKTLQCIALIWTLLKQGPYGGRPVMKKALIITPGSLVKNWQKEIKKWLGNERLSVYAVSTDQRVEDFMNTAIYPVLIISYEMFVRAYEMIQKLRFDLIICDEGHRLKNTAIKTTSLIMSLPTRKRVVLTGTPIQNDLQEFYSIVEFCNPGILGSSSAFKNIYENPIVASRQPGASQEVLDIGEERASELSRLIKLFLLRRTQEINNKYLPPKSEVVVFCSPSDLQMQLYRVLLSCRLIRACLTGQMEGAPHLICIGALKQLCNHPLLLHSKAKNAHQNSLDEESSVYEGLFPLYPEGLLEEEHLERFSGKLQVLAGLLADLHKQCPTEKVVLVSNHTKTLDVLQKFCDQKRYGFLRLDGQTPTNRRQELVTKFNNKFSKEFVFLLSSKAGGVGLNLIGASRLVLYDIDWNPANDLQAMARVWRDGQTKQVYIYRLLTTGSIEEKIYQRQITKQGLSGAVMESKAGKNDVQFSREDLKDLFSLNVNTLCDTHELLCCDCQGGIDTVGGSSSSGTALSSVRPCQLGSGSNQKAAKRNLGMEELMDWKHVRGNSGQTNPEWFLDGVTGDVSFIFWHETKS